MSSADIPTTERVVARIELPLAAGEVAAAMSAVAAEHPHARIRAGGDPSVIELVVDEPAG